MRAWPLPAASRRARFTKDLGRPEAARVVKEASIAEASARQAAEQERLTVIDGDTTPDTDQPTPAAIAA
jgi:hypothetical protein